MITGPRLVALHVRHFSNTVFLDCRRFILALSVCDGTNITMIANNCPPLNETSYSKFAREFPAESLLSPTEMARVGLDDASGRVLRPEDTKGGEDGEEK